MVRPDWDEYFLRMAELAAQRSTCPRRAVGAVLVREQRLIASGYNGSLRGQAHCLEAGCLLVDGHCKRTVHAELNALLQCAVHGLASRGTTMFVTSFPCMDCAKALVQAGVVEVCYRDPYADPHSRDLLEQAGVRLRQLMPPVGGGEGGTRMAVRALDGRRPDTAGAVFIAPSAEVDGDVALAAGTTVWYGAVLRGDIAPIRVGEDSNIQDGCILHTDADCPCVVGCRVTVGHGAMLHGCTVEDDALIGMRATVLSGASVGRGALVAAGSLVRERQVVPPGMLVAGVPARVVRAVRPEEVERARHGAEHYVELGRLHRAAQADA